MKKLPRLKRKQSAFKILLLAIVIVLFWHGAEGLIETYLLPNNPVWSDIAAILIALAIIYLAKFNLKDLD